MRNDAVEHRVVPPSVPSLSENFLTIRTVVGEGEL